MTEYNLRNLLKIKNGKDHKNVSDGNIPIFGSGGIMRYGDKYLYNKESILLPRKGSLTNIQFSNVPFWTVDTLYYTEINAELADPYYLYSYLRILNLERLNTGTGVPSMTFDSYYDIKVQLPSIEVQKKLSAALFNVESKIELNNRINDNLEQMAKVLYDYWFVQFDFPDKNGKPYKSSGNKMFYNDALKREIPEGWEVHRLGTLLHTVLGGTPSTKAKEYWNGDINWLNSGEVANFPIVSSELKITEAGIKNSATELLPKGSVLLSITRHLRPTVLAVDACANQSVIGIKENDDIKFYFLHPYLKNEIPRLMKLRTGAQQPHINKEIVDDSLIVVPNNVSGVLREYNRSVESCYKSIINNSFQTQRLIELRDWLLPMLMNGQVTSG